MGSQMSQLGLGQGERGRKSRLVQGEETRLGLKREREGEPGAGLAQGEKVRRERAGTGLGREKEKKGEPGQGKRKQGKRKEKPGLGRGPGKRGGREISGPGSERRK